MVSSQAAVLIVVLFVFFSSTLLSISLSIYSYIYTLTMRSRTRRNEEKKETEKKLFINIKKYTNYIENDRRCVCARSSSDVASSAACRKKEKCSHTKKK